MIVNAQTGQIVQQANYSSFGEVAFKSGDFISLGFAGGITGEDSDLVRFGARDYNPQTGRWTSKDPIRFDGDGSNLFRYAENNPINLMDPTGNLGDWEKRIQQIENKTSQQNKNKPVTPFTKNIPMNGANPKTQCESWDKICQINEKTRAKWKKADEERRKRVQDVLDGKSCQ